jgi:hypothetical protein
MDTLTKLTAYRKHRNNITSNAKTTIFEDCIKTLDIVEQERPQYKRFTRKGRGRIVYYGLGLQALHAGKKKLALVNLFKTIRYAPYHWKAYVRCCQVLLSAIAIR